MQTRLLPLLHTLQNNPPPLTGLWVVHTDEPLAVDWLVEACRPLWHDNNQLIKRFELISPKSWHEVMNELTSLSLFEEHTVLIVTGKHKPDTKDKALLSSLTQFVQDVNDGTSRNQLLWCLPKQDKKSLTSKAMDFFVKHGCIVDGTVYDETLRGELLVWKARQLGLTLEDTAWHTLMNATEKNLLTAYQALWRLSFLSHADVIGVDELRQALVAGADFNVFDLSDNLLLGDGIKVIKILTHLKRTDTAPSLVLWAVAKDARLILQLQAGKNPYELGIWQNKVQLYTNTAHRTQHISHTWLGQIYAIDKAIKGVSPLDVWGALQRLCLGLCGIDLVI